MLAHYLERRPRCVKVLQKMSDGFSTAGMESLERLRDFFFEYDLDNSGELDLKEFSLALENLGTTFSKKDLRTLFGIIDADGSGTLSLDEITQLIACEHGISAVARAEEKHSQGKINMAQLSRQTMLHHAVNLIDADGFTSLLEGGAEVNALDGAYTKYTPLHVAAISNNGEFCELLVKHKANINARDYKQLTPLHHAVKKSAADACFMLLELGAHVNPATIGGKTPLHFAVQRRGRIGIVKELIKRRADTNVADKQEQRTPLHDAASRGHLDICMALINAGAHVDTRGGQQQTALHEAADSGHADVCRLLIERGASVYARDRDGCRPLELAAAANHSTTYLDLVFSGSDHASEGDARDYLPLAAVRVPKSFRPKQVVRRTMPIHPGG
jgi:ankyrin repeat protein